MRLDGSAGVSYNPKCFSLGQNSRRAGNLGVIQLLGKRRATAGPFKTNSQMHSLVPFTTYSFSEISTYLNTGMKLFPVPQKLL